MQYNESEWPGQLKGILHESSTASLPMNIPDITFKDFIVDFKYNKYNVL